MVEAGGSISRQINLFSSESITSLLSIVISRLWGGFRSRAGRTRISPGSGSFSDLIRDSDGDIGSRSENVLASRFIEPPCASAAPERRLNHFRSRGGGPAAGPMRVAGAGAAVKPYPAHLVRSDIGTVSFVGDWRFSKFAHSRQAIFGSGTGEFLKYRNINRF